MAVAEDKAAEMGAAELESQELDVGAPAYAERPELAGPIAENVVEEESDFASFSLGSREPGRPTAEPEPPEEQPNPELVAETPDAEGQWLWVDPRYESGYNPAAFELTGFLDRATKLFQSKSWTRGRKPGRLAVRPERPDQDEQEANGLKSAAENIGLEVVYDSRVPPGTYWLGLATDEQGQQPTDA
jgi:hypothetical protein